LFNTPLTFPPVVTPSQLVGQTFRFRLLCLCGAFFCFCLCFRFALCGSGTLLLGFFLLLSLQSHYSGFFGGLCRFPRHGSNRLWSLLPAIVVLGLVQQLLGFGEGGRCVLLGSCCSRNPDSVTGFKKVQRSFRVNSVHRVTYWLHLGGIQPPRQEFIFHINRLDSPFRVRANNVLCYH